MARFTLFLTVFLSCCGQLLGQGTCTTTSVSYQRTTSTGYYSEPYYETYRCGLFNWARCTRTLYRQRTQTVYRQSSVYRTKCCSGYSGSNCEAGCDPSCRNGGTCSSPNTCSCRSGWSGSQCTTPVCRQRCVNGRCTRPNTCSCHSGWTGATCSQPVCSPSCMNGGTCSSPYTCTCTDGWIGESCTNAVCVSSCLNGGTCSSPNTCSCRSGWSGSQCTIPVCRPLCVNGRCTRPNTCSCHRGWTGATCSQPVCSPSCKNGGTCSSPNTCTCTDGWNGESCTNDIDECAVENGGCHHTCHNTPGSFECRCNSGHSQASDGRTCNEPPGVPRNVTVSNVGQRSATVSWTPPHNSFPNSLTAVSSYHITASQNQFQDQGNRVATIGDQSQMYELTNLEEFTTYSLHVAASNSFGEGAASDPIEATTLQAAPSAPPLAVQTSSNSSYNITLQWSPPPDIDINGLILHYQVHVTETETGTEFQWISSELSTTLGSLHAFFHYECRVAAHTAAGSGPFSAVVTTQTLPTVPGAVENLQVDVMSDGLFHVSWDPPLSPNGVLTGYQVVVTNLINSQEVKLDMVSAKVTELSITSGIRPYIRYSVSVTASTSVGAGDSVVVTLYTKEGLPNGSPLNIVVTRSSATSASIEWDEIGVEDLRGWLVGYEVGYERLRSGHQCPASDWVGNETLSVDTEMLVVTGLDPGLQYCVWVAGRTSPGLGLSSYSLIPWYENTVFAITLERNNCSEWIAEGLDQIVDDLARGISAGIELNCHCEFPSDYVTDLQPMCNDQGLRFHGRIISTNTSTSTDLLAALEKYVSAEETVTVKGEELPIVKNKTNEPPESGNAEHINQEDTPTKGFRMVVTAAPVGGVVLLLVIVVAIVTVVVCRRQQRKKSSVAVTSTTGNHTLSGQYDCYSNYTYITPVGQTHDGPQKDYSIDDEKQGKEVEYEIPVVGDENIYEDPDMLMVYTVNPTYNIVPVAGDVEGSVEQIYSEIK